MSTKPLSKSKQFLKQALDGKNPSPTGEEILAATIGSEVGGGEPLNSAYWVADAIVNRSRDRIRSPNQVALRDDQFSGWDRFNDNTAATGIRDWSLTPKTPESTPEQMNLFKLLAKQLMAGKYEPRSKTTHFYNPAKTSPKWNSHYNAITNIGGHTYGRVLNKDRKSYEYGAD